MGLPDKNDMPEGTGAPTVKPIEPQTSEHERYRALQLAQNVPCGGSGVNAADTHVAMAEVYYQYIMNGPPAPAEDAAEDAE